MTAVLSQTHATAKAAPLIIKDLTLHLPDGRPLFSGINVTFSRQFTGIGGPHAQRQIDVGANHGESRGRE